jgi:hypothetical protein
MGVNMKCKVCGVTPSMGCTLIRQNPKGEIGVWCCEAHSKPISNEVAQDIANVQLMVKNDNLKDQKDVTILNPNTDFSFLQKLQ